MSKTLDAILENAFPVEEEGNNFSEEQIATSDETQPQATQAPSAWSAAAKAEWPNLSPVVKEEIFRREQDVAKGFQEKGEKIKAFELLEHVLQHHRDKIIKNFGTLEKGLDHLLQMAEFADENPHGFVHFIAAHYGVNPALKQSGQIAEAMFRQFKVLQQLQKESNEWALAQLQQFSEDISYPHFNEVRADMGKLLKAGAAKNLVEAYEKSVWARPDLRERILKDQRGDNGKTPRTTTASAASLRGAPAATSSYGMKRSLDEIIGDAYDRYAGRS
ncbi:MAG: hypothetical protein ACOYK8_00465 [Alphaproteobacteria bacterium]